MVDKKSTARKATKTEELQTQEANPTEMPSTPQEGSNTTPEPPLDQPQPKKEQAKPLTVHQPA